MIEFAIIFIMIVIILVVGYSLLHLGISSQQKVPTSSAFESTSFTPTQMYLDNAGGTGLALNESSKTICLIQSSTLPPQTLDYTDLVASFLVKNGVVLQQTLREKPQNMAELAKKSQEQLETRSGRVEITPSPEDQTQQIDLHLVIHDQERPNHVINFLDMDAKEGGVIYKKAMASAKHWHHLTSDLIQQANAHQPSPDHLPQRQSDRPPQILSVADEIEKLNDLLDKNVISQADFDLQKEKLLSRK